MQRAELSRKNVDTGFLSLFSSFLSFFERSALFLFYFNFNVSLFFLQEADINKLFLNRIYFYFFKLSLRVRIVRSIKEELCVRLVYHVQS